jgi:Zn-dependent protease
MWINLMPVPPLDGSKILMGILPYSLATRFAAAERYGMLILMFLIFTGVFTYIIMPFIRLTAYLIFTIFGIN